MQVDISQIDMTATTLDGSILHDQDVSYFNYIPTATVFTLPLFMIQRDVSKLKLHPGYRIGMDCHVIALFCHSL